MRSDGKPCRRAIVLIGLAATACRPEGGHRDVSAAPAFDVVLPAEVIHLAGTEPFWGGEVKSGSFRYTTPEVPEGSAVAVRAFRGLNGLGFSGTLDGKAVDLTVSLATCSDGMSDRSYPFAATLKIGEDQHSGCAWTDRHPFVEAMPQTVSPGPGTPDNATEPGEPIAG